MLFSFSETRSTRDESVCFNYKHQNEIIKICVITHKNAYTDIRTCSRSAKSNYQPQKRSGISERVYAVAMLTANRASTTTSEVLVRATCRIYVDFRVRRRGETTAIIL